MLRKCLMVAALCLMPAVAQARFEQNDWEITLGGTGRSGNDGGFQADVNGSLGYFLNPNLEIALRQSITYDDISPAGGDGKDINGSTRVALDYHFDMDALQPFIGANVGYVYGEGVADTFEAAPEAGVKYFVNSTTFIYGMAEYQFFFDDADEADDAFDDGQFLYSLGIGFRF